MSDTVEALAQQLNSDQLSTQISAAEALAGLAEDARPAIVKLVKYAGSDEEDLSNWCTAALESVGEPSIDQIDELALLASSANENAAFWAATLLGRAGKNATPALPALADRANDPSTPEVQKRAAWAVEKIQTS